MVKYKENLNDQFQYLGRWVDKKHFRAFVYNEKGEQKLADSYTEYQDLIASGIWFAEKLIVPQGKRKNKHGASVSDR